MFSVAASPFHLIKQNSQTKKAHRGYWSSGSWEKGLALASHPRAAVGLHTQPVSLKFTNSDTVDPPPTEVPRGLGRTRVMTLQGSWRQDPEPAISLILCFITEKGPEKNTFSMVKTGDDFVFSRFSHYFLTSSQEQAVFLEAEERTRLNQSPLDPWGRCLPTPRHPHHPPLQPSSSPWPGAGPSPRRAGPRSDGRSGWWAAGHPGQAAADELQHGHLGRGVLHGHAVRPQPREYVLPARSPGWLGHPGVHTTIFSERVRGRFSLVGEAGACWFRCMILSTGPGPLKYKATSTAAREAPCVQGGDEPVPSAPSIAPGTHWVQNHLRNNTTTRGEVFFFP